MASHCLCGKPFNVEHAQSCPTGVFSIIRQNEIRHLTASLMIEVCHTVSVEPVLQPLSGEQLSTNSAVTTDEARAGIQARGFWGDQKQQAFFDVKVFNPYAKSYRDSPLATCYRKCELEKKRSYEERIREVEHAWVLHPSDLLNSRWYEQGDDNNVQAPCITDFHQEITAVLKGNELDQMSDWVCPP